MAAYCSVSTLFIDIECLKDRENKLMIKELAIAKLDGSLQSWIFAPPYSAQRLPKWVRKQNKWISNNLHHIDWEDGVLSPERINEIFDDYVPLGSLVYVKGQEKCHLLQSKLDGRHVKNLEDFDCPSAERIVDADPVKCLHGHSKRCALSKCLRYLKWFRSNKLSPTVLAKYDNLWRNWDPQQ
jgi:hypothetical protein